MNGFLSVMSMMMKDFILFFSIYTVGVCSLYFKNNIDVDINNEYIEQIYVIIKKNDGFYYNIDKSMENRWTDEMCVLCCYKYIVDEIS